MMTQSLTASVVPFENETLPVPEKSTAIVATVVPAALVTVPVNPGPCDDVSVAVRPSALSTSVRSAFDITDEKPKPIVAVPLSVTTCAPPVIFHAGAVAAARLNDPIAPV